MQSLLIDNNNVIELQRLRDEVTGNAIIDAVVDITVFDGAWVPVVGQVWPASMDHVSDGLYRTILDSRLELRKGGTYIGVITAEIPSGEQGRWEIQMKAAAGKVF